MYGNKPMPLMDINTSHYKMWDFGISLTAARLNRKMSVEELAEKVGITTEYYYDIVNNQTVPTMDLVIKMCVVLNAHVIITTESEY